MSDRGSISGASPCRPKRRRQKASQVSEDALIGRTLAFTFDRASRLTKTVEGGTTRRYAYDRNTNRCATAAEGTCPPTAADHLYDDADRITASPFASVYLFDARGNLTATTGRPGFPSVNFAHDGNDHAVKVDDGVRRVREVLTPSGRVLQRIVHDSVTGAGVERSIFGYDGSGDSPAYQQTMPLDLGITQPTWASPVLLAEDWDQFSSSWDASRWATSVSSTAAVDNPTWAKGRMYVSGSGDARAMATNTAAVGDSEAVMSFKFSDLNNRSGLRVGLRGCSSVPACSGLPMNSGYRVDVVSDQSTISVRRIVGGSHTTLPDGTFSFSKVLSQDYRLRVRLVGFTVSVKIWKVGDPEPVNWNKVVTDTDTAKVGGAGKLHLQHNGTSGAREVELDDLVYTDLSKIRSTYVGGPGGLVITDVNGERAYPLANGHGDVIGTTDIVGGFTAAPVTDEFGKGAAPGSRLGWLGSHQRFTTHAATGIMRMGVRLYDPSLGRFLQVDPVEGGTTTNDYAYVRDPVNQFDLTGEGLFGIKCKSADGPLTLWDVSRNGRLSAAGASHARLATTVPSTFLPVRSSASVWPRAMRMDADELVPAFLMPPVLVLPPLGPRANSRTTSGPPGCFVTTLALAARTTR